MFLKKLSLVSYSNSLYCKPTTALKLLSINLTKERLMKVIRIIVFVLASLLLSLILPTAEAIEITAINEKLINELQRDFNLSQIPSRENLDKAQWDCQLYGMRSRLQSTKKNKFYKLLFVSDNKVTNSGSQIIKEYVATTKGLAGKAGPILEEVRRTAEGRLMGEISITPLVSEKVAVNVKKVESQARTGNEVIAYSVCN